MESVISEIYTILDEYRNMFKIPQLSMSYLSLDDMNDRKHNKILNDTKMDRFIKTHNRQVFEDSPLQLGDFPMEHYCRPWFKLTKEQKLNRLMDYSKRMQKKYQLNEAEEKQLSYVLIDAVNADRLIRKDDVDYLDEEARVINIYSLKREDKRFYLAGNVEHKTIITDTFVPLDLSKLIKPKITIKR